MNNYGAEDLMYNPERVKDARDLLQEIKDDIYDADCMLYDGVMKVAYSYGVENVEQEDTAIDMRMPEKLMIQCREETSNVSDTLDNQVQLIENFLHGEDVSSAQARRSGTVTAEMTDLGGGIYEESGTMPQLLYGPPNQMPSTDVVTTQQLLYGPPPSTIMPMTGVSTLPQLLYGPPSQTPITSVQTLYGVPRPGIGTLPPVTVPMTSVQALYGVPSPGIGTLPPVPVPMTSIQALYGPPGMIPKPAVPTPTTFIVEVPKTPVTQPPVVIPTTSAPTPQFRETPTALAPHSGVSLEPSSPVGSGSGSGSSGGTSTIAYSAIPQTGVGKKNRFEDYIVPAAVGAISGAAGVAVSRKLKKDIDNEEEEENN